MKLTVSQSQNSTLRVRGPNSTFPAVAEMHAARAPNEKGMESFTEYLSGLLAQMENKACYKHQAFPKGNEA